MNGTRQHSYALRLPGAGGGVIERAERRQLLRFSASQHAIIAVGSHDPQICELLELSGKGAKLRLEHRQSPKIGSKLRLQLLDGLSIDCRVIWSAEDLLGVSLTEPIQEPLDHCDASDLGRDAYIRMLRLQSLAMRR